MIPLTVREIKRLLAAALHRPNPADTSNTGSPGDADTRPEHDGSTNAHDSTANTPWSTSNWRLPY